MLCGSRIHINVDYIIMFILLNDESQLRRFSTNYIYIKLLTLLKIIGRSPNVTYWECSRRRGLNHCTASVIQRNMEFRRGDNTHSHSPVIGAETVLVIQANVRKMAVENIFESAGAIVQRTVMNQVQVLAPNPELPSIHSLVS